MYKSLLNYFIGKRYYPIRYNLSKGGFYSIYAALTTAMIVNLELSLLSRYGLGIGLVSFYLILIYWLEIKSTKKKIESD